jgi:hypothetical protein
LSGWLIRKVSEMAEELTELYDRKPLSFYDAQAVVLRIGPAERECHPLESAILNRSTAKCIKLFTT